MKFRLALLITLVVSVLLPSAAGAQDEARIHLIHGIPDTDVDVNVGGAAVTEALEAGLVREDRKVVYPIRDSIPVLLIDEGLPV